MAESGVAHKDAAQSRVNIFDGEIVGECALLQFSRRSDEFQTRTAINARDRQGTAVNPESKLLLLTHAFEDWGAIRLFLKTDSLNERSRAAILKLGAKYEGDLRNHRIRPDGSYRHSSYYSVLDSEWPAVKRALEERLASY